MRWAHALSFSLEMLRPYVELFARRRLLGAAVIVGVVLSACSSDGGDQTNGATATSTAQATQRPAGPTADLSEQLTGGQGPFIAAAEPGPSLDDAGYVEHEYVASGTATTYTSPAPMPPDGRFVITEGVKGEYRTRVLVRRPDSPERFNGTVIVEWLNVTGGLDAAPDYTHAADEILRGGYAWVGVSAQRVGVEGGDVVVGVPGVGDLPGMGLKAMDPARYGTLQHPGDGFSYDIFTQVARALREPNGSGALGDLTAERVLAAGQSQSAFMLTTYINGVQPLTKAFDGFLVHSRAGGSAPLGEPGVAMDVVAAITGPQAIIRTDIEVPVMIVETENDVTSVIGYYPSRQDDSERIRLWEMAGTAHADTTVVGAIGDTLDCGAPINDGPQHFLVKSALRALDTWVRTGEAPPSAPRLEVDVASGAPVIRREANGIALGGIRTPQVDVPVATLSGEPGSSSPTIICLLLGTTIPFTEERLSELYESREQYLQSYETAADAAISAGFVLEDDRQAMLDDAQPDVIRE